MNLTQNLEEYLAKEKKFTGEVHPRVLQLSGSDVFADNGFPRIGITDQNYPYYLDSQQENRALWYMNAIGRIGDRDEKTLRDACKYIKKINNLNNAQSGISAMVHGLYCALNIRNISEIKGYRKKVIEIGAGSGWNSFFLKKFGFEVAVVDVNPNFVMTQEKLFKDNSLNIERIYWWDFYNYQNSMNYKYNIMVANHMYCELSEWSRLYIAKFIKTRIENGLTIIQGWGDQRFTTKKMALDTLGFHDLRLIMTNDKKFPEIDIIALEKRKENFLINNIKRKIKNPVKKLRNYEINFGIKAEEIIRSEGFSELDFNNQTFLWAGIRH